MNAAEETTAEQTLTEVDTILDRLLAYEIEVYQNWNAGYTESVSRTDSKNENFRQVIGSGEFINWVSRGLWFVIDEGILNRQTLPYQIPGHGTHNDGSLIMDVWFRVTGGYGFVKFSNIVLWF